MIALGVLCTLGAAAPPDARASGGAPRTVGVPIPGTSLVRGKATMTINAPIDKIRDTVLDFGHYAEFMPHYRKCKILGHTLSGGREVYMEVTALSGLVTMWARLEIKKPTTVDGVEIHETRFLEGNVKDLKATWRFRRIDDASTEVTIEVFLNPRLPLPDSVINKENMGGAADALLALKKRATGG